MSPLIGEFKGVFLYLYETRMTLMISNCILLLNKKVQFNFTKLYKWIIYKISVFLQDRILGFINRKKSSRYRTRLLSRHQEHLPGRNQNPNSLPHAGLVFHFRHKLMVPQNHLDMHLFLLSNIPRKTSFPKL